MELFTRLPDDLVRRIVVLSGGLVWRHGVYLGRLSPGDARYALLRNVPRPVSSYVSSVCLAEIFYLTVDIRVPGHILYTFKNASRIGSDDGVYCRW